MEREKTVGKDEKAQHKKYIERRRGHKWLYILSKEKKDTKKLLNCRLKERERRGNGNNNNDDDDVVVSEDIKGRRANLLYKRALCNF